MNRQFPTTNAETVRITGLPFVTAVAVVLCLFAGLGGCDEEKRTKPFKSTKSRKAKRPTAQKKEKLEKTDPIDEAWNSPPTEGMSKIRVALHGDDGMIKGRPVFMAPQFELIAVEYLEKLHEDGFRVTDRKKSAKFNPNEHGRYVYELKPGHWKVYVTPLDDLWQPWISDVVMVKKGQSLSVDVQLVRPAGQRKKY